MRATAWPRRATEEEETFQSRAAESGRGRVKPTQGVFCRVASKATEAAEAAFEVSKQSVSPVTAGFQTRLLPLRPRSRGVGRPPGSSSLRPSSLLSRFPSGYEPPIPATNNPSNQLTRRPSNGRRGGGPLPAPHLSRTRAQPPMHLQPTREGTALGAAAGPRPDCGFLPRTVFAPAPKRSHPLAALVLLGFNLPRNVARRDLRRVSVRNVSDFETALQSSPELAALARGEQTTVSVSHPPLPPLAVGGREPGRRRVRRVAPACQWQPRILEEVGSCPEYFSSRAPPLESEAAVFCGQSRARGVWGSCQTRDWETFFPWGGGGEEGRPFSHLLQFSNQTHPRQPREERPEGETQGARLVSPPPPGEGCGRCARGRQEGSRFWARPPPRGTGDSGCRAGSSSPGLEARRCAEQERGTKERRGEGSELGKGETPAGCQKIPAGGSPSVT
ncbi:uncharacterized protein LOC123621703 [Lemur catta]|uniref:uncharacterized protein LOC123621703 n=1 Tax=Lemur catta TaxID=9447 RepID=UPI001E26BA49|nr:uncharacterized protein LOC123621703 [Lemur catta]